MQVDLLSIESWDLIDGNLVSKLSDNVCSTDIMSDTALLSPEYNGTKLLKFTAVFIPTQIIAVGLRYLARHVAKGTWGIDDVIVMTSLSLQMCMAGLSIGGCLSLHCFPQV